MLNALSLPEGLRFGTLTAKCEIMRSHLCAAATAVFFYQERPLQPCLPCLTLHSLPPQTAPFMQRLPRLMR